MLALMALRVPIAMAMFVPGAVGYVAAQRAGRRCSTTSRALAFARLANLRPVGHPAVPADGPVRDAGRAVAQRCSRLASALIGHLRGGLAMAAVLACAAFGAICGSSVATAATMAQVALPEMRRHDYSGRLATGDAGRRRHARHPDPAVGDRWWSTRILDRAEHRQAVRGRADPGHDRGRRLPRSRSPSTCAAHPDEGAGEPRASRGRAAAPRCATSGRSPRSSCSCSAASTAASFTPTEGAGRRRGRAPSSPRSRRRELDARRHPALLLRHRRDLRHDLHDLPRRRHAQLGAGAVAVAGAARADRRRQRPAAAGGRRRHPAVLRRARLRDGRAVDDPADHADLLPDGDGPGPVRARPDREERSGSASWCCWSSRSA